MKVKEIELDITEVCYAVCKHIAETYGSKSMKWEVSEFDPDKLNSIVFRAVEDER